MLTVKHLVIFGRQERTELYTSRALMFQGFPAQRFADKITVWSLFLQKDWKRLRFALMPYNLFKPLRAIRLWFPYETAPAAFTAGLEQVLWHIEEVVVE